MKRFHTRIPGSILKERLDYFLCEWLPSALGKPIPKTAVRKLILSGSVYVNRHREKNPTIYAYTGAVIEVYYDEEKLNIRGGGPRQNEVRFNPRHIVFEDEWLIVVDKPPGIPSQPTIDPDRANLYQSIKDLLKHREKVEDHYLGMHHRLDKDTSGLIMFTKKEDANVGVAKLFTEHQIQKTYQCIVSRLPGSAPRGVEDEFRIDSYMGKLGKVDGKTVYGTLKSGGDIAITDIRVLEVFRDAFWLQARPKTGRTHQIRVHCSELGYPILGDTTYFPQNVVSFIEVPRLMLHAAQLEFIHPMTGQKMELASPIPEEFVNLLGQLKA